MTAKTTNTETLEHLSEAERKATEAAAKAQAAAARARAEQARKNATINYAKNIRASYKDRRPALLQARTEARTAFDDAVKSGESFGPQFLKLMESEAALYVLELERAEALAMLGQSAMNWPQPPRVDLAAAIAAALEGEARRISQDAVDTMKAERSTWIAQQAASDTPAPTKGDTAA